MRGVRGVFRLAVTVDKVQVGVVTAGKVQVGVGIADRVQVGAVIADKVQAVVGMPTLGIHLDC